MLGRLTIAWGDQVVPVDRLFLVGSLVGTAYADDVAVDFHADAIDHRPDPIYSRHFGRVLSQLLEGKHIVITDRVFADPARRDVVAEFYQRVLPELEVIQIKADGKLRTGPAAESAHGIIVDADVYEENEIGGSDERISVTSSTDVATLRTALLAAAERMMLVDEHGREYADHDELYAEDNEVYTPNYCSAVEIAADGSVGFYIDCKSSIGPPMAAKFRAVLVEELTLHGVAQAHVVNGSR